MLYFLKIINLSDIKLKGAIKSAGTNLAYFASTPDEIKNFKRYVPRAQNKTRLIRYLIPDFE